MRKISFFFIIILIPVLRICGQNYKSDTRSQILKEDSNNKWTSDQINTLDLLQALSINGIRIHKFDLGKFDTVYNFYILVDEFVDGKIIKTDTLIDEKNEYVSMKQGEKGYFIHYIDQVKIISQDDENMSQVKLFTYFLETRKHELKCKKNKPNQFYTWRDYGDTSWKPNQKIPLSIFASSWEDKKFNIQRFCGVVKLEENEKQTVELLTSSPHYYRISYLVN